MLMFSSCETVHNVISSCVDGKIQNSTGFQLSHKTNSKDYD